MVGGSDTLTREAYFGAAMEVLAEAGPAALTVSELCGRLGVTKGSFYHHFDSRAHFVQSLLDYWAESHAAQLAAVLQSAEPPYERVTLLKALAVRLPHEAEAAIRAWSSHDGAVAEAQSRVDRMRREHLRKVYVGAGMPDERALLLATIGLCVLAGMQMTVRPADPRLVSRIFDEVESAFFGAGIA